MLTSGRGGIPIGQVRLRQKDNCGHAATSIDDDWAMWTHADEFGEGEDLCGLEQGLLEVIRLVLNLERWVEFE